MKITSRWTLLTSATALAALSWGSGCASGGESAGSSSSGARGGSGGSAAGAAGSGGTAASGGSTSAGGSGNGGSGAGTTGGNGGSGASAAAGGSAGSAGNGGSGASAAGGSAGSAGSGASSSGGSAGSGGAAGSGGSGGNNGELCNGLDDNGDGNVDEGDPEGGGSCTRSGESGVCAVGIEHCTAGSLRCEEATPPSVEVCDGLDNNCNGSTDENNPEGGQLCGTGLMGICADGLTRCDAGSLSCDPNAQPGERAEVCNGLDDNCDGTPDEGDPGGGIACTVTDGGGAPLDGPCGMGTSSCTAGQNICVQLTFPVSEVCDGVDNDCNGALDDAPGGQTLPGVGDVCAVGGQQGTCGVGAQVCSGGSLSCPQTNNARTERCDGADDDCDGTVDDGTAIDLCTQNCRDSGAIGGSQTIPNVLGNTLSCNSGLGVCELNGANCPPGTVDADGQICNGCEDTVCSDSHSSTCGAGDSLLIGSTNGQVVTVGGVAWFRATIAQPVPPTSNPNFEPRIRLSEASLTNGYQMDVYSQECSGTTLTCPVTESLNNSMPVTGVGPSQGTGSDIEMWSMSFGDRPPCNTTGGGLCTDKSSAPAVVYIKITRTALNGGGANPECNNFNLTFSTTP